MANKMASTFNINTKILILLFLFFILFFIIHKVYAIGEGWQLLTPKMVLRGEAGEEIKGSIGIRNLNNNIVFIKLEIHNDLVNATKLEQENFSLAFNETKFINFTSKFKKPGIYNGEIIAVFSSEQRDIGQAIGLTSQITIIVEEKQKSFNYLFLIPVFIIIAIILIFLIKKSEKFRKN